MREIYIHDQLTNKSISIIVKSIIPIIIVIIIKK